MKQLITITLFLATHLFANYAFTNEKTVKIDMHGGNSEQYTKQSGFSQMIGKGGLKNMGSMNIKEPTKPTIPKIKEVELINDKK